MSVDADTALRETFLEPIRKCREYVPAFGRGRSGAETGLDLPAFQLLYGADIFYAWLGLDSPSVYAAHKAAGGLTSVYRQIGVGSERIFRAVVMRTCGLTSEQIDWSYEYSKPDRTTAVHTLDACLRTNSLTGETLARFRKWLKDAKKVVTPGSSGNARITGAVFEVRQGYKSADSKRQNADLRYGIRAYQDGLLPIVAVMSSQVSVPVMRRYAGDGMLVLKGVLGDDPTVSTFAFFKEIVGFDLAAFFERNSAKIKKEVQDVVEYLLAP